MNVPFWMLWASLSGCAALGVIAGVLIGWRMPSRRTVSAENMEISVTVVGLDEAAARLDALREKANGLVDAMLRVEDVAARLPESR